MKKLFLLLPLILGGCGRVMTNEEVIKQTKLCEDAGMDATLSYNGMTGAPHAIYCWPKSK